MVDIGILRNEPNEYFDIFLTPILFYSFVLDHSKMMGNVLLDSNVDDFGYHIWTDVHVVILLVFYVRLAMGHDIFS